MCKGNGKGIEKGWKRDGDRDIMGEIRGKVPLLTDTVEEMVPAVNHNQPTKGKQGLGLEGARREVALKVIVSFRFF